MTSQDWRWAIGTVLVSCVVGWFVIWKACGTDGE
mgnify:FL=1